MSQFANLAKTAVKAKTVVGPKGPSVSLTAQVTETEIIIRIPRHYKDTDMRVTALKPNTTQKPFVAFKADLGESVEVTVTDADGNAIPIYTRRNITGNLFCGWTPQNVKSDDGDDE